MQTWRIINIEKGPKGHVDTLVGQLYVEERGAGAVLLCWPSLFCDSRTLQPIIDEFARDHRVIVIDGPGHGKSGSSGHRFSLADCADAAMRVLDAMNVERATWIGARTVKKLIGWLSFMPLRAHSI